MHNIELQHNFCRPVKYSSEDNSSGVWYSTFVLESGELIHGTWEDEIIWDSDAMPLVEKQKILILDPNDENIILSVPDDVDLQKHQAEAVVPAKVKITHPHIKKSKILLGKAGVINNVLKDDVPPPSSKPLDQDPFNISNDG